MYSDESSSHFSEPYPLFADPVLLQRRQTGTGQWYYAGALSDSVAVEVTPFNLYVKRAHLPSRPDYMSVMAWVGATPESCTGEIFVLSHENHKHCETYYRYRDVSKTIGTVYMPKFLFDDGAESRLYLELCVQRVKAIRRDNDNGAARSYFAHEDRFKFRF